ncbi:hypothetical protein FOZ60_006250 [Perkinsus olseni]|uniref:Uncharacterized protein n=1 Tax=Perkinsus olseni TaxID=32597 RepID=A0A7J6NP92_PEROL|nr:hypothetical protein FOZ60_006250 [Perkinsus olseni]
MALLDTGATGNFVRADVHKALAVKANTSLRWPERKSQRIATLADNKSRATITAYVVEDLSLLLVIGVPALQALRSDAVGDGESDLVRDVHQRYPREVVHVNSTRTGRLVADFTFADEAPFDALQGKGWRAAVARARKSSHGKTLQQKQQINEAIDKLLSSGFVGYMKLASIERPPPGHSIARLNSLNPRIRGTHLVHENYLDEHLPVFTAAQAVKKEPDHFVPHSKLTTVSQPAVAVKVREGGKKVYTLRMLANLNHWAAFNEASRARSLAHHGRPCELVVGDAVFHLKGKSSKLSTRVAGPFSVDAIDDDHKDTVIIRGANHSTCRVLVSNLVKVPPLTSDEDRAVSSSAPRPDLSPCGYAWSLDHLPPVQVIPPTNCPRKKQ